MARMVWSQEYDKFPKITKYFQIHGQPTLTSVIIEVLESCSSPVETNITAHELDASIEDSLISSS